MVIVIVIVVIVIVMVMVIIIIIIVIRINPPPPHAYSTPHSRLIIKECLGKVDLQTLLGLTCLRPFCSVLAIGRKP